MKKGLIPRVVAAALAASILPLGPLGCDRVRGLIERLRGKGAKRSAAVTDRERILRKFGEPAERLGLGSAVRSEHGIRYNRKWNYFYRSGKARGPTLRTVYFVDGSFTGSVVRRPDGTIIKEKIKFSY